MMQRHFRPLILLSFLVLLLPAGIAAAASSTGQLEVGATISRANDNMTRVNEYTKNGITDESSDGGAIAIKGEISTVDGNSATDFSVDVTDADRFNLETKFDINRILKLDIELDSLQHWKDKENLRQLGATMLGDVGGNQPKVVTNLTGADGADYSTLEEAQAQYYEEQSNDYLITRREWTNDADLRIPQLPNIVFHAGLRIETRRGMEQSITMSKCNACHVEAEGKDINERTEDVTLGMTGKFGRLTVDYEYLNRKFEDSSSIEEYNYLSSSVIRDGVQDSEQLLYTGNNEYSSTPDSDKDSHTIKARFDFTRDTTLSGSYVKADIESEKAATVDDGTTYTFETDNTLKSEYTGYTGKLSTRIGNFRLSARANIYEIDGPEYTLTFVDREDIETDPLDATTSYLSAESREVTELGVDGVYRFGVGTTLRLGYEYEEIERDEKTLGETETHTIKIALNSRISRKLSLRGSYEYQDISDPFTLEDGTGIGQITGVDVGGGAMVLNTADFRPDNPFNSTIYYWNSVYPNRELDATNQPEEVHEAKGSVNWSPATNFSATLAARVRQEENTAVNYKQTTYVPSLTFWYAPNGKMNLTMAYTFNKQKTENNMCVGWYHG